MNNSTKNFRITINNNALESTQNKFMFDNEGCWNENQDHNQMHFLLLDASTHVSPGHLSLLCVAVVIYVVCDI